MKQQMIGFLLAHANPSIQLRIKKEVLQTITKQEEKALQEQILNEMRRTNLEKVEWLCRCGLYPYLPELQEEVRFVIDHIDPDGICSADIYEGVFRGWSPYFGAQLETDWRAKRRRQCDITFRALLIAHYAGILD